jgi:putative alpha-1,2-mannosidase
MHRYVNLSEDELHILIDLRHRDKLRDYEIDVVSDRVIRGKRISQAWANEQHVYFYMEFSAPFTSSPFSSNESIDSMSNQFTQLSFGVLDSLLVKVGISAVDISGAQQNIDIEQVKQSVEQCLEDSGVQGRSEVVILNNNPG